MLTLPVHNRHRRHLAADVEAAGALIDGIGAPGDGLWPVQDQIPIRIDRPLVIGAVGAHGPAAYRVVGHQPGRWLRLEFSRPRSLVGFHEFTATPHPGGGVVLEHLLAVRLRPLGWLLYPVGLRALHDEVIEAMLDRAEAVLGGGPAPTPAFSRAVRARIRALRLFKM